METLTRFQTWNILSKVYYDYAYTMPGIPHHYTHRLKWRNYEGVEDSDYERVFHAVYKHGEWGSWGNQRRCYFRANGYQWWFMTEDVKESVILNRCPIYYPFGKRYDKVAGRHDSRFDRERDRSEKIEHYRLVPLEFPVLDIGCGTGRLVDYAGTYVSPSKYVGIDPSIGMLGQFHLKHPRFEIGRALIPTELKHYVTDRRFRTILAMYGVGSYLDANHLERIDELLEPGGTALVSYYGSPESMSERHERLGFEAPRGFVLRCPELPEMVGGFVKKQWQKKSG